MNRPGIILDQYYDEILKPYFVNNWRIDIDDLKKKLDDYKSPEYSHIISESEHKRFIVGNCLWYLYSHFHKVKSSLEFIYKTLNGKQEYTSLISPGDKYTLDIGSGLLTGTLAYVSFLKEHVELNKDFDRLYVIANESDKLKIELLRSNKKNIETLINGFLGIDYAQVEFIENDFPDSIPEIKAFLKKKQYFKELLIINACILKWIDHFSAEMYEEINAFSNRTHLLNIEPTNREEIVSRLNVIRDFKSEKIGRLLNYDGEINYSYSNHPDGPFANRSSSSGSFKLLYCYETNLEKNFFSNERLKSAYYKTRPNIIGSHYYDRIDLIIFDKTLNESLGELSELIAKKEDAGNPSFKFAHTLDYKIHKNKKDEKYLFRNMSTRKIDNEIASVAIIEPLAETDSYIEETSGKNCSYGNRIDFRSKFRFYSYFLDAWLDFRTRALNFAKQNNYLIYQYDIEKYYENIDIKKLTSLLSSYCRPKNDFVIELTRNMLNIKCYTTTKKENCPICSYEDKDKRDCNEKYGLPQGPISSGFYANIYLYPLDETMAGTEGIGEDFLYLRYVDDILVVTSEENIRKVDIILKETATKLGLKLGSEKTEKYSSADFEKKSYSQDVVDLCKQASSFMDLFYYVPDDYYNRRTDSDFLKNYRRCLAQLGLNLTDIDFLSKKLDRANNYRSIYTILFKHKCYGVHALHQRIIDNFIFPPVTMISDPVQWGNSLLTSNPEVQSKIEELRKTIYETVCELYGAYKTTSDQIVGRQLRSLLFRGRYYYDPKYKKIASEVIENYPYLIPYKLLLDLTSGCDSDAQAYITKLLERYTSSYEYLKDNGLLVAQAMKHLGEHYNNKEAFATLVACLVRFYKITKIDTDKGLVNENPYRVKYPSGYVVLLLSVTEAILSIPKEHWVAEEAKKQLFHSLQLLLNMLNIEQTYLKNLDKILYSFKKAIKRNIVTIMATVLDSPEFIDLNLLYTSKHIKDVLKMYVQGRFDFSCYITSESENHEPAELLSDEETIAY